MLGSEGNLYFQKQMDILRKQVEKLTSKIEINSTAIKSLLKDLDYVVE